MKHVMQELGELAGLDVVLAKAPVSAGEPFGEPARPTADHRFADAVTALRAWLFGPKGPSLARDARCPGDMAREPAGAGAQAAPSPLAER